MSYDALWRCELSGGSECFRSFIPVATARINQDGSFVFEVPDVLADPVVRRFEYPGAFLMSVHDSCVVWNNSAGAGEWADDARGSILSAAARAHDQAVTMRRT